MSFVVPDACSLPTSEQPLRVAEFESLFDRAVESVVRVDDRHLRIDLRGGPGLEAQVRDLAARENGCCGFFGFTVTGTSETVRLEVEVPPAYVAVLDGLAGLAQRTTG